jgi:hypothetical protein
VLQCLLAARTHLAQAATLDTFPATWTGPLPTPLAALVAGTAGHGAAAAAAVGGSPGGQGGSWAAALAGRGLAGGLAAIMDAYQQVGWGAAGKGTCKMLLYIMY